MSTGSPPDRSSRVIVVDDSPAFREVAREVVDATPGFATVALLPDAHDLVETLEREPAHLVLLDVRMPNGGGVGAARALRDLPARPTVVLVSADECPWIAADPTAHGADAFIRKEQLRPAVLQALQHLPAT